MGSNERNDMDKKYDIPATRAGTPAHDERRPWVRPRVAKIRAGEAELGANPIKPDGAFSVGS
jgi:hypothetical protein